MRVIILDKNSHLKFHSISLAFLVRKIDQKQISLEITRQRNKHGMTRNLMRRIPFSAAKTDETNFLLVKNQSFCRVSHKNLKENIFKLITHFC